jgi:putative transposase
VQVDERVVNQGVLIVSGVRNDGFREILAVEVADTESEAIYQELFRSLKRRGLSGVELVISDDHEGLKSAISRQFQGASHQRCQVHYSRNLLGMVSVAKRKELASDLRAIFAAPAKEQALQIASSVAEKWRKKKGNEKVAEHIEEFLSCLSFPESHRRRIRTTNGLERLNQEIKRRTRVVRIFPNPRACVRLVSALAVEQSEEWLTGRRFLDMSEIEERYAERESEEAMLIER